MEDSTLFDTLKEAGDIMDAVDKQLNEERKAFDWIANESGQAQLSDEYHGLTGNAQEIYNTPVSEIK